MTEFTASNGVGVDLNDDEQIIFDVPNRPTSPIWMRPQETEALAEYFRAQEDKRLGRWRWPENTDYVVYRDHGAHYIDQPAVIVVNETTGGSAYAVTGSISASGVGACDDEMLTAVQAYFDAHPDPKPWHDARPGEVWVLTVDGEESAFYPSKSLDRAFTPVKPETGRTAVAFDSFEITDGRRIWPEGDAS